MNDQQSSFTFSCLWRFCLVLVLATAHIAFDGPFTAGITAHAQQSAPTPPAKAPAHDWSAAIRSPQNSITVPQSTPANAAPSPNNGIPIKLVALLTNEGPQIDKGLVWRVYDLGSNALINTAPKLLSTHRLNAPTVTLRPGNYAINVAFGQAYLTRKITVKPGTGKIENFILNAGGLRLHALLADGTSPPPGSITYDIFSDQRNQFGERTRIISDFKPGIIVRLNAGIYYIVSKYGDANSRVKSEVGVEAGKVSEVSVKHAAARVTLKLVTRAGGEALADARWQLQTAKGATVLKTVGAIPTFILAVGTYIVTVRYGADILKRTFTVSAGQDVAVEVIMP